MAKTRQQIEAALAKRYDGRTDTKNGMTYAAWEDIAYAANEAFGPLGYSRTFMVYPHQEGDGYACVLRIEVFFTDDDGALRSIQVDGQGYNEMSNSANAIDTAIKGCAADAFKKALSFLGDAFGLYIGAEAKAEKAAAKNGNGGGYQRASTSGQAPPASGGQGGWYCEPALKDVGGTEPGHKGLSHAQISAVKKYGVSDEELEAMTRADAKAILDNKGRPGAPSQSEQRAAATASRVGTPVDEDDELDPFA